MQTVQLELPKEYESDINFIKSELADLKKNFQPKEPNEYLTRNNVAKMFSVDLSTVHNWTKRGILHAKQIGGHVFYLRDEVENAIVKLKK